MISDIGYALHSVASLVLLLLLLTVRKSGLAKYLLMLATIANLLWSTGLVTYLTGPLDARSLVLSDTAKQGIWLLFLASCLRRDFNSLWQVLRQPASLLIISLPILTLALLLFAPLESTWLFVLQTLLALEVLILLEVLYRQTGEDQWAFKPLVLYLGVTNLFEFVMYANATMLDSIEPGYVAARGYIYTLMMPFLVIAIRRIKHWGVNIFISREIVLHSSLLLVAGAYLLVMATIGYIINYLGWSWGGTVQIVLVALSLALLVSLFLSNSFRTRIKVFITKHFFANQFDYRIEWVKLTKSLSQPCDSINDVYETALHSVLNAINYDCGRLLKLNQQQLTLVAGHNQTHLNPEVLRELRPLVTFWQQTPWMVDLQEYRVKPFDYNGLKLNLEVLGQADFQLVVPLYRGESLWGMVLLCAKDRPQLNLNWEVRDYLTAVIDQVANYVFHHEAAQSVAENAQFAAFSRMSAFVLHDLKNVLAQIDLILANAQQHKDNPEFIDDTFETLEHTRSRMNKMLRQLTEKNVAEKGVDSAHRLSGIIRDVINQRCQSLAPTPVLSVESEQEVVIDAEKFSNVMYHLLSNAQQATSDDGSVKVQVALRPEDHSLSVLIIDTGEGMSEAFIRDRLFKPFDTTKGNAGMGIGAYDAKNYLESIGGTLSVESVVSQGTTFTLTIPLD